jgi:hypothetical protein
MILPGELSANAAQRLANCFGVQAFLDEEKGTWWAWAEEDDDDTILGGAEIRLNQTLALKLHAFHLSEVLAQPAQIRQP